MSIFILLTQQNMITSSSESFINRSVINRHSSILIRKRAPVRSVVAAPIHKTIVKKRPEKVTIKATVNDKPKQQIIEEIPKIIVENPPIEVQPKEEPINDVFMEDAVQTVVNEVPVERKVEIEQRNISNILDNKVANTSRHYTYNSILGAVIRHD